MKSPSNNGKPVNLKIKITPDKRFKRKYSAKAYKNASEIMRDSYTDVELTPKSNDPKIFAYRFEQRML